MHDKLHSCSVALRVGTTLHTLAESLLWGLGILPLRPMTSCQQKVGLAGMAARTEMNPWGGSGDVSSVFLAGASWTDGSPAPASASPGRRRSLLAEPASSEALAVGSAASQG